VNDVFNEVQVQSDKPKDQPYKNKVSKQIDLSEDPDENSKDE